MKLKTPITQLKKKEQTLVAPQKKTDVKHLTLVAQHHPPLKRKKYALVKWKEWILNGVLNDNESRLYNLKNSKLFLSLGKDTTILKRFATKAEMNNYKQ